MAETFNTFLVVMALVALVVFIALYFVEAGYGMLFNKNGDCLFQIVGGGCLWKPLFYSHGGPMVFFRPPHRTRLSVFFSSFPVALSTKSVHISIPDKRK